MKIPIENCKVEFAFECPKEWDKLAKTNDPLIRNCDVCQRNVHYCDTVQLAKHMAAKGWCVAIDPNAEEYEADYGYPKKTDKGKIRVGNLKVRKPPLQGS